MRCLDITTKKQLITLYVDLIHIGASNQTKSDLKNCIELLPKSEQNNRGVFVTNEIA